MSKLVRLHLHISVDMLRSSILPSARRRVPVKRPPVLSPRQTTLWEALAGKCESYGKHVDLTMERLENPLETMSQIREWVTSRLAHKGWKIASIAKVATDDEAVTWKLAVMMESDG